MGKDHFTVADYMRLPDDLRAEVHEGVLAMIPAPDPYHQVVQSRLQAAVRAWIDPQEVDRVLAAPVDLFIDDETVLQPDLLVLPEGTRVTRRPYRIPLPIWVAEVLSPSTASRDRGIKLDICRRAGIREAWLLDPDEEVVEVHDLRSGEFVSFGIDEVARSRILDRFTIPVADLFPAADPPSSAPNR